MPTKLSYQFVKSYFEEHDCVLLSEKYQNSRTKLNYVCNCGNESTVRYSDFQRGDRCRICAVSRRKITNIQRYGTSFPLQNTFIKNKVRKTKLKKYGNESYNNRDKCKTTNLQRYGVEWLQNGHGYSKESQLLFWDIYNNLPKQFQEKTYFAELNKEYVTRNNKSSYLYDFVISSIKKCIEFNGSAFHPKPVLLDEDVGWFAFDKKLTAGEKRKYDNIKNKTLEERGFDILVI